MYTLSIQFFTICKINPDEEPYDNEDNEIFRSGPFLFVKEHDYYFVDCNDSYKLEELLALYRLAYPNDDTDEIAVDRISRFRALEECAKLLSLM